MTPDMPWCTPNYKCSQMFPGISEVQLSIAEQTLGARLPTEYREFLLHYNGIVFESGHPVFSIQGDVDDEEKWGVSRLYGVAVDKDALRRNRELPALISRICDDLLEAQAYYSFRERVPGRLLAIAETGSPAQAVCISVAEADRGTIYFWDPGVAFESGENEKTMTYVTQLAPTFCEWWSSLQPSPTFWEPSEQHLWQADGCKVQLQKLRLYHWELLSTEEKLVMGDPDKIE